MKVGRSLVMLAVAGGAAALVYRFGLTEDARQHLRESAERVRDAYDSVTNAIDHARGITVEEPLETCRERINSEWEALGY